jgi:hypothetical protein
MMVLIHLLASACDLLAFEYNHPTEFEVVWSSGFTLHFHDD